MAEVIKFSEASTMGLHAIMYLAANAKRVVPLKEIAEKLSVSEAHLAKVFQRLGKSGEVKATRGPTGGYELNRSPEQITLLEIYEAIEGPFKLKFCPFGEPVCEDQCCGLGTLIGKQNEELKNFLVKTKVSDTTNIFHKSEGHAKKNRSNK